MRQIGLTVLEVPCPLNLWMNFPVALDGTLTSGEFLSRPEDFVVIRAELDCIVAMSACPWDIASTDGMVCVPTDAHYQVLG